MTRHIAALIGLAAALLLTALFAWHEWSLSRSTAAQAKLATSQANAAIASGADATNIVGSRMDADATADRITRENDHAIHNAAGADAPVGAVGDAGIAGLCQRAAYRNDPRCVQFTPAR